MQKLDKLVTFDFDGTLLDGSNWDDELVPIIGIVELAKRLTKIRKSCFSRTNVE